MRSKTSSLKIWERLSLNKQDIETGIGIAVKLLTKYPKIQTEMEDEPVFTRQITGKFKTAKGKECTVIVNVGFYDDIRAHRLIARGLKNYAILRKIPYDNLEDKIKGPGLKER